MTAFTLPIPTYECHKRVQALKIKLVVANPRGFEINFEDCRYCPIQVDDEWALRHNPLPGGYVVWYPGDNYVSFSPAAAFESGYTLVESDRRQEPYLCEGCIYNGPACAKWDNGECHEGNHYEAAAPQEIIGKEGGAV